MSERNLSLLVFAALCFHRRVQREHGGCRVDGGGVEGRGNLQEVAVGILHLLGRERRQVRMPVPVVDNPPLDKRRLPTVLDQEGCLPHTSLCLHLSLTHHIPQHPLPLLLLLFKQALLVEGEEVPLVLLRVLRLHQLHQLHTAGQQLTVAAVRLHMTLEGAGRRR